MKIILYIFNSPLIPEAGGTERLSHLIMTGLQSRGYKCLGFLEFHKEDDNVLYHGDKISNVYSFLKEHSVDIVINQMGIDTFVLKKFHIQGGAQWRSEGGRVFTCLHFDPNLPSYMRMLINNKFANGTAKEKLLFGIKKMLLPLYIRREKKVVAATYRYLHDNSDLFIMLSKAHYSYFKKLTGIKDESKLRAISNPLTFPDIATPDILDTKQNTVLVVARMDEYYKRISLVLKVWQKVMELEPSCNWNLKIVGEGPSLEDYKQYASKHEILNIKFFGRQPPESYYREAKIFLMTSYNEGWGLTLTESFQRGVVPIVMDSCSVFHEIIDNGITGYITPNNDIKTMATKILSLMQNEQQCHIMATNVLAHASKFNLSNTMHRWINILKN